MTVRILLPLQRSALPHIAESSRIPVEIPSADLLDLPERVAQFGTGAFLRGFIEAYIDDANRRGTFGGRVVAIASTVGGEGRHRELRGQDGLFTLVTRSAEGSTTPARVIASLSRVIAATSEWDDVLALARSPQLELVFSNTTEVGIGDSGDDSLDDRPPRTFAGKLTRFLLERAQTFDFDRARGLAVVPCELIENNGDRLLEVVRITAHRWKVDSRFLIWLNEAVPFSNTLVDRIVPSLSDENDRRRIEVDLGYKDAGLTICEPYRLFAIQADAKARYRLGFARGEPSIILCDDVTPYRRRKLRLLNGPHTIMAPLGLLAGNRTVTEAMSGPVGKLVRRAMRDEIAPHLEAPDAAGYAEDVLARFSNPSIRHELLDIMLQATTKMKVRIVPSILAYTAAEKTPPPVLTTGFAALLRCLRDIDAIAKRVGRAAPADDAAGRIRSAWAISTDTSEVARRVCSDGTLWGTDLDSVPGFTSLVAELLMAVGEPVQPA